MQPGFNLIMKLTRQCPHRTPGTMFVSCWPAEHDANWHGSDRQSDSRRICRARPMGTQPFRLESRILYLCSWVIIFFQTDVQVFIWTGIKYSCIKCKYL